MSRFALFLVVSALAFWACRLTQDGTTEDTVSFTRLYDSLSVYDSVEIVFKDRNGAVLDTVYRGKVDTHSEIERLPVKNWDGGPVVITIVGFNAGIPVYKVEKRFDGTTNLTDTTFILFVPGTTLTTPAREIQLLEGESIPLPAITITPANLSDKTLVWFSSQPEAVQISGAFLKAVKAGVSQITVKLHADTTRSLTLQVTVLAVLRLDSVRIKHPVFPIYTGGESLSLTAQVYPATAPQQIKWRSANIGIAEVDPSGKVTAVSPGKVKIHAISQIDSTRQDSVEITVKRDMPQVSVGADTTISVGRSVTFRPAVTQEYGLVALYQWDLDGNGSWDGSSDSILTRTFRYDSDSTYAARFRIMDSEGNDTMVVKKVKAVRGPVVLIRFPLNNSYTNRSSIQVIWTVDDVVHDSSPEVLKEGANIITRTAKDAAGESFSASITVYLDSSPPDAPRIAGASPTNLLPRWTWSTGGGSGSGDFRFRLADANFPVGAPETRDTAYTLPVPVTGTTYTLFVQERDVAGNWSLSATNSVTFDAQAPDSVTFVGTDKSFTNSRQPTWSWNPSTTNPGIGVYVLAISAGPDAGTTWDVSTNSWKPDLYLADGTYRLTVRQKDQVAGVLGAPRSFTYYVDGTAPTIIVSGYANGSTAPTLTGGNTVTLAGSITDNAGGSGIASATYELSGGTIKAATNIVNLGAFSITTPPMTNHAATTVTLKTRDAANNPQQTYAVQFNVDVKAPTIEIIQAPEDGFVTSAGTVTLKYSLNGAATTIENFPLVEPSGPDQATPTTKVITASNAIGETVSESRTYYKAHASVRFFSPSGGRGDCASWITACAFDSTALAGKENLNLWLLTGNYTANGITLQRGSRLFGQLKPTSKSVTERSAVAVTTLTVSGAPLLFKAPTPVSDTRETSLNYVKITGSSEGPMLNASGYFQTGESLVFDHCLFDGIASTSSSSGAALSAGTFNLAFDFIDSQFRNIYSDVAAVQVQGSNQVNFTRCGFNGDRALYDVIVQYGGSLKFITCTPTQPASDPSTTCTGTTCTSQ